uniref:chitinase n=1 Tax=Glossina palpalis gambiensis TaxID=67801 RepID=A0A1B0AV04_9MUSC
MVSQSSSDRSLRHYKLEEKSANQLLELENEFQTCHSARKWYFTNWAWYRQNGGKYLPEDIDAHLCSHIVYGFALLNRETLTIQPHDSWADLDNHFYERVVTYRSRGIKVNVAMGGWNDSAGDKYTRLVRTAAARSYFTKNVISFMEKYGFEGLDLDWEYPVCWQVGCKKGRPDEKEDWIAVMTYDYHGQWDKKTGHVAPMYDYPGNVENFKVNFSINYWLQMGAERKKLIMGMPMYGQSFTLAQASDHGLNAPYGGGEAGETTRARGFLSYYEICAYIQKFGWNVVRDPRGRMGPFAFLRDQWVSFDDAPMIQHKSEYVKAMSLGGAMIWALDLDDFKNVCNCESYPLLKAINRDACHGVVEELHQLWNIPGNCTVYNGASKNPKFAGGLFELVKFRQY